MSEPTTPEVEDAWTEVYAWLPPGPDRDGLIADVRALVEAVRAEERAASAELRTNRNYWADECRKAWAARDSAVQAAALAEEAARASSEREARLREALRAEVVTPRHVYAATLCLLCRLEWNDGTPETHVVGCLAAPGEA